MTMPTGVLEQDDQTLFVVLITFFVVLISSQYILPAKRGLRTIFGRYHLYNVVVPRAEEDGAAQADESEDRTVSGLFIYPVKSLRAVELDAVQMTAKGFQDDRNYMLIAPLPLPAWKTEFDDDEPTHRFVSQRQCPRLATVVAKIIPVIEEKEDKEGSHDEDDDSEADGYDNEPPVRMCLRFSSHLLPGETLTLPLEDEDEKSNNNTLNGETKQQPQEYLAKLWDDVVRVEDMGDEAARFFVKLLKADDASVLSPVEASRVRLVQQSSLDRRSTAEPFTPASARLLSLVEGSENPPVSLTDGFPILIATEASLAELNRRIKAKGSGKEVTMSRFRPNIVVQGNDMVPFEEDGWKVIAIDDVIFHVVKACPRCKQSCTDQVNGHVYEEPLLTLREFRKMSTKDPDDAFFAQNVIPAAGMEGRTISKGAKVQVLEWGEPVWG